MTARSTSSPVILSVKAFILANATQGYQDDPLIGNSNEGGESENNKDSVLEVAIKRGIIDSSISRASKSSFIEFSATESSATQTAKPQSSVENQSAVCFTSSAYLNQISDWSNR